MIDKGMERTITGTDAATVVETIKNSTTACMPAMMFKEIRIQSYRLLCTERPGLSKWKAGCNFQNIIKQREKGKLALPQPAKEIQGATYLQFANSIHTRYPCTRNTYCPYV